MCCAPTVHLKYNQGQQNSTCVKYLSSYPYLRYKFIPSTATDKQSSVSLNITSVHLSAFVDFANIFIRYRSKQSTSQLSLIPTEMVSTMVFFFSYKKNYSYRTKISINFIDVCSRPPLCILLNLIWVSFHVVL